MHLQDEMITWPRKFYFLTSNMIFITWPLQSYDFMICITLPDKNYAFQNAAQNHFVRRLITVSVPSVAIIQTRIPKVTNERPLPTGWVRRVSVECVGVCCLYRLVFFMMASIRWQAPSPEGSVCPWRWRTYQGNVELSTIEAL